MVAVVMGGPRTWSGTRDSDGHREYKVVHLVRALVSDGPAKVMNAVGLPLVGSRWAFGTDLDTFAWCRPDLSATIHSEKEGDPNVWWRVENTFGTKTNFNQSWCKDGKIESPLLEPQNLAGQTQKIKGNEEATTDRFGVPVMNSAWEPFKGPSIEFDRSGPKIRVQQNVAVLNADLCYNFVDCVNDRTLWGQPPRTVKLTEFSWERKFYGFCYRYYTRQFEFEVDGLTFDRDLLDEGTKVLNGHWDRASGAWVLDNIDGKAPNRFNPHHFIRFKDRNGENSRCILNGRGLPAYVVASYTKAGSPYLSLKDQNLNSSLTDRAAWIPLVGPYNPVPEYVDGKNYPAGSVVVTTIAGALPEIFVAMVANVNVTPPAQEWLSINSPLKLRTGDYDDGKVYAQSDYILVKKSTSVETTAGYIHVEKYPEANFFLLGIPAVL